MNPITYFRRNLGRTLPLAFVIVLSVFLIASVVTIVNSIDLTVLTIYNYTKVFTPVMPRIAAAVPGKSHPRSRRTSRRKFRRRRVWSGRLKRPAFSSTSTRSSGRFRLSASA